MPVDDDNPYAILGFPGGKPPRSADGNFLKEANFRSELDQRVKEAEDKAHEEISKYADPKAGLADRLKKISKAAESLRNNREAMQKLYGGTRTEPDKAKSGRDAQKNAHGEAHKKRTRETYDKQFEDENQYARQTMGGGGFDNLKYLIFMALFVKDGRSPVGVKTVYDKNGKPKKELFWNSGINWDKFKETGDFKELTKGGDRMGLLPDEQCQPLDDEALDFMDAKGCTAFEDFLKPYEKSKAVKVTRDSDGHIVGMEWKDPAKREEALSRLGEHIEHYKAAEAKARAEAKAGSGPTPPGPTPPIR